ncbi:MAG: cell wall hydrolase [Rickettsiales bacterium]|jgi:spore germination cell wall hydrolase CwlJ-like protein|nr:cell wall hydrolase [Rickettsiales bacterium]
MTNAPQTVNNNLSFHGLTGESRPHPHLTVIENTDLPRRALFRMARLIYAETRAASLAEIEALASMVANLVRAGRSLEDMAEDKRLFECLNKSSARHADLLLRHDSAAMQICVRTLARALTGVLADQTRGAARFHRAENLPDWATGVGSVCEIGNLHFYKW